MYFESQWIDKLFPTAMPWYKRIFCGHYFIKIYLADWWDEIYRYRCIHCGKFIYHDSIGPIQYMNKNLIENNPDTKPIGKHEKLIDELRKGIEKYKWQAQMHSDKAVTSDKALSQYFNGMKTAENLFVAHLRNLVRDYGL